jgi:hypothetical protein
MEMKKKRLLTYRGEFGMMTSEMWEQQEIVRLLKGAPGTQYQEADDANKAIMRDWVKSLLQQDTITVTFVKADGTVRDMNCTLNWDLIPTDQVPQKKSETVSIDGIVKESKARKEPDPHSLRVFDMDKQEWRSFRFDRLQKITAQLNVN